MMDYDYFYFACPKLCGGQLFLEMMESAGFRPAELRQVETPFLKKDKLRVSLVKHPIKWLCQCYEGIKHGLIRDFPPFTDLPGHSLDAFLRGYVYDSPRAVSNLFGKYEADSIMRYEDLPWALVELLTTLDIPEDRVKCLVKNFKNRVVTPMMNLPDRSLRERILDAERELCDRVDYV